jgi:PAS domain-containing protein
MSAAAGFEPAVPLPIAELLLGPERVALSLRDRFLSPIAWNPLADAIFGYSRFADGIERNPLVRLEDEFVRRFFGEAYEEHARRSVGLFRRAFDGGDPPAAAREIVARASRLATFRRLWAERSLAGEDPATGTQASIRWHPVGGALRAVALDVEVAGPGWTLRVLAPADEECRAKFALLRALGGSGRSSIGAD